ncbi:MAG: hypothetical protein DWI57_13465 [Chloroflexi bacterium]|nr:MAG: hypothetical protein DWI57_13465 [Chloroflexota bacterium]
MTWRQWLPSPQQMSNAAQMRPNAYVGNTMQQALGMIVLLALLAGLLPSAVHWLVAAQAGTVLPLAQAIESAANAQAMLFGLGLGFPVTSEATALHELYQTLAGLEQPLPDWLAAGLSALGAWLNWPMGWLTLWIVYGALVMVANKSLGGHTTLQRFYAATGFGAVPLLLLGLSPIPGLGALAVVGACGWSLAVYVRANREVTGLEMSRAVAAVLLPALILLLLSLLVTGILLAFFLL